MSNFPLSYKLCWPIRFVAPSLGGDAGGFAPVKGDLLPGRPTATMRLACVGDISAVVGPDAPAVDPEIATALSAADLVIGNCESPLVERVSARLGTRLGFRHAMSPAYLEKFLSNAAIDPKKLVMSLANNHALDQGAAGFEETRERLRHLGIRTIGCAADGKVSRIAAGPLTLGLAAFTQWRNADAAEFEGRVLMEADMARDGWAALDAPETDLLVAAPHWDWEFTHRPRKATRDLATALAGKGVGLVAGHHSHVVQPVERIGDTLVAYGLGDFLGTAWPRQTWPGRIGGILFVDVSTDPASKGRIAAYEIRPFMRLREKRRERLVPIAALEGPFADKVRARLLAVYGGH